MKSKEQMNEPQKEVLRISETSKYFKKKLKMSGDYTKTDSVGRICLYNSKHVFIRYLSVFVLFLIFGCTKSETQKEYTKTTYSNFLGFWDYCRYQSNEIDPELKYIKSEKVFLIDSEVVKDTTICKSLACPRSGELKYSIRYTIE